MMRDKNTNIWVLEDDNSAKFMIQKTLGVRYQLSFFEQINDFLEGLDSLKIQPNAVILDLYIGQDFFFNYLLDSNNSSITLPPTLVVSSSDDMDIMRYCYNFGVVDYLIKPYHKNELIIKIENIVKYNRVLAPKDDFLNHYPVLSKFLTHKEEKILNLFCKNKDQIISKTDLLKNIWNGVTVNPNTINVHIHNLRKKVEPFNISIVFLGKDRWVLENKLSSVE